GRAVERQALDRADLDAQRAGRVELRLAVPLDAAQRLAHRGPDPRGAPALVGRDDRQPPRAVVHQQPRALERRLLRADPIAPHAPVLAVDRDLLDLAPGLAPRRVAAHLIEHALGADRHHDRDLHAVLHREEAGAEGQRLRALGRAHRLAGAGHLHRLAERQRRAGVAEDGLVDEALLFLFFLLVFVGDA